MITLNFTPNGANGVRAEHGGNIYIVYKKNHGYDWFTLTVEEDRQRKTRFAKGAKWDDDIDVSDTTIAWTLDNLCDAISDKHTKYDWKKSNEKE